jgi:4'-phosphopantetheinyl transferase
MTEWQTPSLDVVLGADEVHAWRVALDQSDEVANRLERALSADERARAERLVSPRIRQRFVVARGALREILGRYVGIAPAAVRFRYGARGKPALDVGEATCLRFNLSHSGELALVAVSRGREIGVDVEQIRPDREFDRIASRFFSPAEVATLLALPQGARAEAFYRCWTRKEAYIKANGQGLVIPLDSFDVAFVSSAPAALLANRRDPAEVQRWSMAALDLGAGYAGALVVEGTGWTMWCFA